METIKSDAEYSLKLDQFEEMYAVIELLYNTEIISDVWGSIELRDPEAVTEEAGE